MPTWDKPSKQTKPAPTKAEAKRKPPPTPMELAKGHLEVFWGSSNGGADAWNALEASLRTLKLNKQNFRFLRLNLPVTETPQSTIAARIRRADQTLQLLEEGF